MSTNTKIIDESYELPYSSSSNSSWYCLKPIWRADKNTVKYGLPHDCLAPSWQMLLLGDGSPTRHLNLLTGEKTEVDLIEMSNIGASLDGAPKEYIKLLPEPRLRRQVWLRKESGERLAYATSWWEASTIDGYLQNKNIPIWNSLTNQRTELYRDILDIHYGNSDYFESAFSQKGVFWGRYYIFWHQRKPLTLIYEVFSSCLAKYIGSTVADNK